MFSRCLQYSVLKKKTAPKIFPKIWIHKNWKMHSNIVNCEKILLFSPVRLQLRLRLHGTGPARSRYQIDTTTVFVNYMRKYEATEV